MSAAKLRKFGRGSAIVATTALVMTSFGPAAMAWSPLPGTGGSDTAHVGSLGVIDADTTTQGTQGAQSVQSGVSGQQMADMRMVLPATWQAGDHIDLQLGWTVDGTTFNANDTGDAADRLQWSSAPTVNVDTKAYDGNTRVHSTSTRLNDSDPATDGGTEQHTENAWVNPDPNKVANPVAPKFAAPELVTGQNGTDVVRLTFSNTADKSANSAKYIMSVNGPKVDVGAKVKGDIGVKAIGYTGSGNTAKINALFQDENGVVGDTTWPAFISPVSMTVEGGAIARQKVAQTVGPITVTPTDGVFAGGPVSVAIQDATGKLSKDVEFVEGRATATIYDVLGKVLRTEYVNVVKGGLTVEAPQEAARVVFSGMLAQATENAPNGPSKAYQYALTAAGGETALKGALGGTPGTNQKDITRGDTLRVTSQTTSVIGNRIGGANRYETAVRIAGSRPYNGTIVLTSGERWADAMSAGYLAHTKGAPILLTQNGVIPQPVMEFMKHRGVQRVYIVGGEGVVSKAVETQLRNMGQLYPVPADIPFYGPNPQPDGSVASTAKMNVTRLGGSDRYETNRKTNQYASYNALKGIDTLQTEYGQAAKTSGILVNGQTPWDALAAGPLVAGPKGNGLPIILTTGTTFAPEAGKQIQSLDITQLVMVGGTGVLSDSLKGESNKFGATANLRLAGSDRYGTSKAVGEMLLNEPTRDMPAGYGWGTTPPGQKQDKTAYLANGGQPFDNAFADALAAGPLAISQKSPIVLTARDALPTPSRQFLHEKSAVLDSATALGQGGAVSLAVLNAANALVAK